MQYLRTFMFSTFFVLGERQIIFQTMKVNGDPQLTGKTLVEKHLFRTQNYHMTSESMKHTFYRAVLWCLFFHILMGPGCHPLSLYGKEQCEHFSKHLLSSFTEERMSNGFGMTSGV